MGQLLKYIIIILQVLDNLLAHITVFFENYLILFDLKRNKVRSNLFHNSFHDHCFEAWAITTMIGQIFVTLAYQLLAYQRKSTGRASW